MRNTGPAHATRRALLYRSTILAAAGMTALTAAPGFAQQPAPSTQAAADQPALSLEDCLNLAIKNNPVTDASNVGIDRAQARLDTAKQAFKPQFLLNAHTSMTTSPDVTITANGGDALINRERERATVSMHYILYDAGRRKYDTDAARNEVAAAGARAEGDTGDLLRNTSIAFYDALHAQTSVDIGETVVKSAVDNLDRTKTRFSLGVVTRSDVLAATSALDAARSDLESRKLVLQEADAALAAFIGADPMTPLRLAPAEPPTWNVTDDTVALLNQASAASPRGREIEANRAEAEAGLKSVTAANKPVVTFTTEGGEVALQRTGGSGWASKPFVLFSVSLSMPLFNEAAQRALEREQKDQIKAQEIAHRQLSITLKQQLAVALAQYKTSIARLDIAKDAVDNAAQAYQFEQDKYSVGKATEPEVIESLGQLTVARDQYQQAVNDRDTATQNLRWLVGLDRPTTYMASVKTPATADRPNAGPPKP